LVGDNTGDGAVMLRPIGFWCVGVMDFIWDCLVYTCKLDHTNTQFSARYLRLQTHTHTLRLCNTHCSPTATMVARKRLSFTLYVHCLSCLKLWTSVLVLVLECCEKQSEFDALSCMASGRLRIATFCLHPWVPLWNAVISLMLYVPLRSHSKINTQQVMSNLFLFCVLEYHL